MQRNQRTEIEAKNNFEVLYAAESPGPLWPSLKNSTERGYYKIYDYSCKENKEQS
jgi:hypothetical protein